MIDPVGPLFTNYDSAINSGQNAILTAITQNMGPPVVTAAAIYYVFKGVQLANGERDAMDNFVPQFIRIAVIIWLSTNLDAYDQWVHGTIFVGLPAKLVTVAAGAGTGTAGATILPLGHTDATARIFSTLWNQIWVMIATAWSHAGPVEMVGVIIAGGATAVFGGIGLLILGLIYVCGHMLLAVMDDIMPFLIGMAMFTVTKPFFERAVGKVFSLILVQFIGVIVLQIVLSADQTFMNQVVGSTPAAPGGTIRDAIIEFFSIPPSLAQHDATMAQDMMGLASIVVVQVAGVITMLSVSAIAYSIGTGIAVSTSRALTSAAMAVSMTSTIVEAIQDGFAGMSLGGGGGGFGGMSMAEAGAGDVPMIASGVGMIAPPEPPPSIAFSSRN